MLDITQYQERLRKWQKENIDLYSLTASKTYLALDVFENLAGMTEELGELAHVILKHFQNVSKLSEAEFKDAVSDAFGDLVVFGLQLLSALNISGEEALQKTFEYVLRSTYLERKQNEKTT